MKLILLIEIQSSVVRSTLASFDADDSSQVLFAGNLNNDYKPHAPSSYYIKSTLANVKTAIDTTLRNLHTMSAQSQGHIPKHIDEVHYVLSSPWVISQAKTIKIDFGAETTVTEDKVRKIISRERAEAGVNAGAGTTTIEEKIFDVKLNGYPIISWKDKRAKSLEIAYAFSAGSSGNIDDLCEAAESAVSKKKIFFHSSLLLQYVSLRNAPETANSTYMLVHAHGEITDMVVVDRGSCSFFGTYPMGIQSIVRSIAEATHTETRTADSLLALYLGGHMEETEKIRAGVEINALAAKWTGELDQLWKKANAGMTPESILLIAHSHADLFEKSLLAAYPKTHIKKLERDAAGSYLSAIKRFL